MCVWCCVVVGTLLCRSLGWGQHSGHETLRRCPAHAGRTFSAWVATGSRTGRAEHRSQGVVAVRFPTGGSGERSASQTAQPSYRLGKATLERWPGGPARPAKTACDEAWRGRTGGPCRPVETVFGEAWRGMPGRPSPRSRCRISSARCGEAAPSAQPIQPTLKSARCWELTRRPSPPSRDGSEAAPAPPRRFSAKCGEVAPAARPAQPRHGFRRGMARAIRRSSPLS